MQNREMIMTVFVFTLLVSFISISFEGSIIGHVVEESLTKQNMYDQALSDIKTMSDVGFSIEVVNKTYQQALEIDNISLIERYVRDIEISRIRSFELNDDLSVKKEQIEKLESDGSYVDEIWATYNETLDAFSKGDLELADDFANELDKLISNAQSASEFEKLYIKVQKQNFFSPLLKHKYVVLTVIIILSIISIFISKPIYMKYLELKLNRLNIQ